MKILNIKNLQHQLLQFGIVALLISIPLYPKFPMFSVPGTYVSIRIEDILIAIITIIWIVTYRFKIFTYFFGPLGKKIIAFLCIGSLSLISALLITQTVTPHLGILHTARRFEYLLIFFITLSTIKSRKDLLLYIKVIILTAFLIFIYGAGQKFLGWPIISTMNKEYSRGIAQSIMPGGRINSTFAGHYDLAAYSVLLLNVLVGFFFGIRSKLSKLFIFITILSTYWLLIASSSRISFAAYLGSITLTLWFSRKRLLIVPVLVLSLASSIFAPSLLTRYAETARYEFLPRIQAIQLPKLPWKRQLAVLPTPTRIPSPTPTLEPGQKPTGPARPRPTATPTPTEIPEATASAPINYAPPMEDRSTAIRFNVEWPRALRAFYKNPLLGTGYSSISLATDNDYLRMIGEIGLLGIISFLLIFIALLTQVKSIIFKKPQTFWDYAVIGIAGSVVGFMANALFIDVFEASKVAILFWMLMAIMIKMADIRCMERKSALSS
jgi:hypothetical protein